jgi:hypothetical protein
MLVEQPEGLLEMTLSNGMAHDPIDPIAVVRKVWMNGRPPERDHGRVFSIHHEGCVGMTVDLHLVSFEWRIHRLGRQRATTAEPDLTTLVGEFAHPPQVTRPPRTGSTGVKTRGNLTQQKAKRGGRRRTGSLAPPDGVGYWRR